VSDFNPSAIMEVLARHDVSYVLIGGYAALLQGSGVSTIDIDIVPARARSNLANLAAALRELDAKIRAAGTEPLPFSASEESLQGVSVLNLTTRFGDLDSVRQVVRVRASRPNSATRESMQNTVQS
jgi:hypothetical protein